MKDKIPPQRLLASDDEVARILGALEHDAPSPGGPTALLARIDAAERGGDGKPAAIGSKAARIRNLALLGGFLMATGLFVAAARHETTSRHSEVEVRTVTGAAVPESASPRQTTEPNPAPVQTSSVAVDQLPQVPSTHAAAPVPVQPSSPSSARPSRVTTQGGEAAGDSFREQLALVQSARRSLADGKADDCLTTLRRYDMTYPRGLFTAEVQVVRVEALMATGQTDKAYGVARKLVAENPHGPYADRLRVLLSKTDGPEQ